MQERPRMHSQLYDLPVKLVGEYAEAGLPFQPVVLTRLSENSCLASKCGPSPPLGTQVDVWIGAIGPLSATVAECQTDEIRMKFHTPLASAVLSHFAEL